MENKLDTLLSQLKEQSVEINKNYAAREKKMEFPIDHWRKLGELKLQGAIISPDMGGLGLSKTEYAKVLKSLGYYCIDNGLNFGTMAHTLACLWPIEMFAQSSQIKDLIPSFSNGKSILSNAITEDQGGSNVYEMTTTAKNNGDHFVLNGKKSFCSNIPVADYAMVYAVTDPGKGFIGGISAFLIPLQLEGITKSENFEKMGLRTANSGTLEFNNVLLPSHFLVGKEGLGGTIFQESMVLEKIYMAMAHTGTLQRWLEQCIEFARNRKSGSNALIKQQSVAHILAELKISLETGTALVERAVQNLESQKLVQKIESAAIVKYQMSNIMVAAAQKYLNLFAGYGYKSQNGIEVQVRDFMGCTIYSGTNEIQKNIISSSF